MAHVLITGASGYIGQHLVHSLAEEGHTVRGFSRRARPHGFAGHEWQQGDVREVEDIRGAVIGCDVLVHLAASRLNLDGADPEHDFQVNAAGTLNLLSALKSAGAGRMIYASTAQIYGRSSRVPMAEDDPPLPHTSYAASKLCGEVLCTTFARCYGVDVAALRLFNVYGPSLNGQERPTVESIFVRCALEELPLVIKADPQETRDFIHVNDAVHAFRMAMKAKVSGQVINIGTGVMTAIADLADMVIDLSGSASQVRFEDTSRGSMRMQADVRKARRVLGFEAEIGLREGIGQMIEAQRGRGKGSA